MNKIGNGLNEMCKVLRVIQVAWRRARGGKKNGVRATAHPRRYGIY